MCKRLIFFLFFVPIFLFSFEVENFEQKIIECTRYDANYISKDNYLYVDARGAIEKYEIIENGSLELISRIDKLSYSLVKPVIFNNRLFYYDYQLTSDATSSIGVVDISENNFELVGRIPYNGWSIRRLETDGNFLYMTDEDVNYARIYNPITLDLIGTLSCDKQIAIKDSIMFNYNTQLGRMSILNISDSSNPIQISYIDIGMMEVLADFYIHNNKIFLQLERHIVMIDFSNLENPTVVFTLEVPYTDQYYDFIEGLVIYNNYMILRNYKSKFWVYDISDIFNPSLINFEIWESSASNNNGLILVDDFIYFSTSEKKIHKIDVSTLPNLNIELVGGQPRPITTISPIEINNNIFFSNPEAVMYFNKFETSPQIRILKELNQESSYNIIAQNDSLLCLIYRDENFNKLLDIYFFENEDIILLQTLDIPDNVDQMNVYNNFIFLRINDNSYDVYEVLSGDTVNFLENIFVGENVQFAGLDQSFNTNMLYLTYKDETNSGVLHLSIRQSNSIFEEVENIEFDLNDYSIWNCYLIDTDKIIFYFSNTSQRKLKLCEYDNTGSYEVLDSYQTPKHLFFNKSYIAETYLEDNKFKIIEYNDNEFDISSTYECDFDVMNVISSPETNEVYTIGRYNIARFSADFTSQQSEVIPITLQNIFNYPNPFNPTTTISFNLPEKTKYAELNIYNIRGQNVYSKKLNSEEIKSVKVTWVAEGKSSGIYFSEIKTESGLSLKNKMILMK